MYLVLKEVVEDEENVGVKVFQGANALGQSAFGIANVVLYAILYPTYARKVKNILRCRFSDIRVSPN